MELIKDAGQYAEPDASGAAYEEHLRRPDLSLGTYSLKSWSHRPAGPARRGRDLRRHRGAWAVHQRGQTIDVAAGSVFFVPAHEVHRFHDVTEDLAVLVFFGPAEGSRAR